MMRGNCCQASSQFRLGQGLQHFAPPLIRAQIHDAGGCRRGDAHHVEVAGQIARRQHAMLSQALGASPIRLAQLRFVLDEMAERITDRPRSAGQFDGPLLTAEPQQSLSVIGHQALVIPTNGPPHLIVVAVDAASGVMRGGDAAGPPVLEPVVIGNWRTMARVLARAWPSSCIRFSSATLPPGVHRSVGRRTWARIWPSRSKARHLTAPVLKSQPVRTVSAGTWRRGSGMDSSNGQGGGMVWPLTVVAGCASSGHFQFMPMSGRWQR